MPKGVYVHKSPSKETIEKRRLAMKGRIPKNVVAGWNKGKKGCYTLSKETKMKISEHHKRTGVGKWMIGRTGAECNNWKGGVSRNKHSLGEPRYKKWRSEVFIRDNWTCQTCGVRGIYLEAHHIKSWAKFPELRYVLENGICLCKDCHALTDNYKGKNR